MKMIMGTRLIAIVGLTAGLAACGDDSTSPGTDTTPSETTQDTTPQETQQDTTPQETQQDTTPQETQQDTTPQETQQDTTPTETETVTPTCDQTGITGEPFMDYNADSDYVAFGLSGESAEMVLEFYDVGAGSPLTGPGSYPLGGNLDDQNYATCATCGLIFTEDKIFFATSGTITVNSVDQAAFQVNASLSDAIFVEVTINNSTFESTPVAGGEVWCVPSASIVYEPECTSDADCSGATPFCDTEAQVCAGCLGPFDCTNPANPVCGQDDSGVLMCLTGIDLCTGDDANEHGDDGPAGANPLTVDTPVNAKICGDVGGDSIAELDWYTFTLAAETNLDITLTFAAELDIDFYVFDEAGEQVGSAATLDVPETLRLTAVPAGKYYIVVNSYEGAPSAAVDYTLLVATFTPECTTSADCTADPARPACDTFALVCVACVSDFDCTAANPVCQSGDDGQPRCGIVDACTGDDAREHGDDGPAGATVVTLPSDPIAGKICGEGGTPSAAESDFFKVTLAADQSLTINLAWEGAEVDLDLYVLDATGAVVDDGATIANPEELTLSNPGAGDYYILVYSYEGAPTEAIDYTLTLMLAMP